MFRYIKFTAAVLSLLLFTLNAFGQGTTGQIAGTVTDPNGAVVAGATVTATNIATNYTRETTTGSDGIYGIQLLPPGRYRIDITGPGFEKNTVEADVNITQTTPVNVQLSVAGSTATVNVEAPVLQTETSQNGRTVTGETIRQLPLPTRNFQQLLTLSPGAQNSLSNSTDLGRGDVSVSVNGQKPTSNNVRINGVDANSIGTNSTPNLAVPASDTLQEFIVQTSLYDASTGRNAGGNVEAVTRSGSNDFHGGAYYFLRPRAMAANEPFIKGRGLDKPELSRHQFGGLLGGRIIKDRLFFFGSYQHSQERNGYSLLNSLTSPVVPAGLRDDNRTAAGLAATFGVASVNPVALAMLTAKLPNGKFAIPSSGVASASNPFAPVTVPQSGVSTFRENQFNANFDVNFTSKHSLSAKFFLADNPTFQANYNFAGLGNGEIQLVGFGGDLTIKQKLYSITDTYVFSPNVVNQFRFGFNRLRVTSVPEEPFSAAQLGITSPLAAIYPGAPTIRVVGADSQFFFGSSPLADQSSRINGYNFADTLSVTHGNHRLRAGAEFRYSTIKFYFNAFSRGQILFPSFSAFLNGGSFGTTVSLLGSGVFDRFFRVKDWSGFVQDDWKVHPRLTVNLGLRYDLYGMPAEDQGRLVNFLPGQAVVGTAAAPAGPPNGFVQAEGGRLAGVPTVEKTLVPTDKNNFGPRVGFAYVLDEDLNLVVRGGYGVYYDRFSTRFANTQLFNFPYFALGVGLPGIPGLQTFANPFLNMPAPSTFPVAATIPSPLTPLAFPTVGVPIAGIFVDPDLKTPMVQQYNIGLQWEIAHNFVWDVGYVGNSGQNILQLVTLNQPIFNPANSSFATRWPTTVISGNKNVTGGVQQLQTTSRSSYNSLQSSLSKRFSSGVQFLAAYTFGKAIDYYGSQNTLNEIGNVPGDQVNWKSNRGRADFNREQRFVFSGVYDLPWKVKSGAGKWFVNDWQIAGIAAFQSGLPFSIVADNGTTIISRANYNRAFNGDIYTAGDVRNRLGAYFNTAAFVTPCINAACTLVVTSPTNPITNPNFDPAAPFGNTPRNGFTGPGQKNVDLSVIKFIPFTERFRGEIRAEFFNVFNWVNYANPNNNLLGANFGKIVRASSGPRVIQLGFKLNF